MKAEELRIGNYVNRLGYDFYNDSIFPDGTKELETVNINILQSILNGNDDLTRGVYEPKPLTEELLLKLGFEQLGVNFQKNNISIWYSSYQKSYQLRYYLIGDYGNERKVNLEFIHQLQNIYFDITGEELTINI